MNTLIKNTYQTTASKTALILALGAVFSAPNLSAATESLADSEQWSEWKAMDQGFVARRRQPPKINLPKSERKRSAKQSTLKTHKKKTGKTALWLRTDAEGIYSVALSELAAQSGTNEKSIRNGALTLTNNDQPVTWHLDSTGDRLVFIGQAYNNFYTDKNAYHFKAGGGKKGPQMPENNGAPTTNAGVSQPFPESLSFEEEPDMFFSTWSVAAEEDADYWFWDYLYGGFKDSIDLNLHVPNPAASGMAQLKVTLRGFTNVKHGDEHEVYAVLNGQEIGSSVVWDALNLVELVVDFDQSLLNSDGNNTLQLKNKYEDGTHAGQWLDQITLDYQRQPVAEDGQLWLHDVAPGTQTVSGFSSADIFLIESPATHPVLRRDIRIDATAGSFSVTFEANADTDYLVVENTAIATPLIAADTPSTLYKQTNSADYLIITPEAFAGTAQTLANYRANHYSDVKVVFLQDIYDEYSAGRVDPFAIARFIDTVQNDWQSTLETVVLIGKGTLDHKDRMGYADSFLPSVMTSTPFSLAGSDDRLLGANGDAPFAIGRLPITEDAEGIAYVEKVIAYESAAVDDAIYDAVLVADNPDSAGHFHENSDILAAYMTDNLGFNSVSKLYHPNNDVRSTFIKSETWNVGYISYDGHGSTSQIGDNNEKFLNAADAGALENSILPIFSALTCSAGDDTIPGVNSLASALVLNPGGGALSAIGPTGLSLDYDAQILNDFFVDSLFIANNNLGDAIKEAKLLTQGQIRSYMQRMYSVIGDPAVNAR